MKIEIFLDVTLCQMLDSEDEKYYSL